MMEDMEAIKDMEAWVSLMAPIGRIPDVEDMSSGPTAAILGLLVSQGE